MAFPVIQTADSKHGTVVANSTSWTLTYPTNLVSGDLIFAALALDGAVSGLTWPSGWIAQGNATAANAINVAKKLSDGTETGNFTVTTPSEQGGWRVLRITGWEGTIGTTFDESTDAGAVTRQASSAGSPSANPNPPSLDPANWATEDTLWLAVASVDTSRTFSAWPTSYSPGDSTWDDVSGGAGGASLSVQWRNNAVSSEDPGTFTISTSDDWVAATIAVRPAAAAAATSFVLPNRNTRTKRLQRFLTR